VLTKRFVVAGVCLVTGLAVLVGVLPTSVAPATASPVVPVVPADPVVPPVTPDPVAVTPAGVAPSNTMVLPGVDDGSLSNPIVSEDTDKRGEYSKTFTLTDGSYEAVSYLFPVHYKNGTKWVDIDNSLVSGVDPVDTSPVWGNTANPFGVRFAKKSTPNQLVSVSVGSDKVSWHFDGQAKVDGVVDPVVSPSGTVTGNQKKIMVPNIASGVSYSGVFRGVDVRYAMVSESVKESIILANSSAQHVFTVVLETGKLTATAMADGSVSLVDPVSGKTVFGFAAPFMVDAGGVTSDGVTVSLALVRKGEYTLTLTADPVWLGDSSRVWPVTIDPSVSSGLDSSQVVDTYVSSGSPTTAYGSAAAMGVGVSQSGVVSRALVKFPVLPTISGWYSISSASVRLTSYTAGPEVNNFAANPQLGVYQMTGSWTPGSATWSGLGWASNPTTGLKSAADSVQTVGSAGQVVFDVTPSVQSWYAGTTNNGVVVRALSEAVPTADQVVWFASVDWSGKTPADYPVLTVDYVTDSTPPNASIAYSATVPPSGWYTTAPTLTFNASDTESGVQSVTRSITGPVTSTTVVGVGSTYTPYSPGVYTVTEVVVDKSGNKASASTTFRFDKVAPTGQVVFTPAVVPGTWSAVAPVVAFDGADADSGVQSVTYSVSGAASVTDASGAQGLTYIPAVAGIHTITATVTDVAGNVTTTPASTVRYDPLPPVTSITTTVQPGANGWYSTAPTLTFHATDPDSGLKTVTYSVDGTAILVNVPTSDGGTYTPSAPGSYVVTMVATDVVGNVSKSAIAINYSPNPAMVWITADPGTPNGTNSWYTSVPTLTYHVADPSSVKSLTYQVSGSATIAATTTTNGGTYTPAKPGYYTVTLTMTTTTGVVTSAVCWFQVDPNPPLWSLADGSGPGWSAQRTIVWSVGDQALDQASYRIALGQYSVGTFPLAKSSPLSYAYNATTNGVYTVYAKDMAGNASVASITMTGVIMPIPRTGYTRSDTDLSVPAPGFPMAFTRTYDSMSTTTGPLGKGWAMAYAGTCLDYSYTNAAGGLESLPVYKVVTIPGMATEYFAAEGSSYTGITTRDTLVKNPDGSFALTTPNVVYSFDASGHMTRMADRHGNTVTITLGANHYPATIQDSAGRQYTFTYTTNDRIASISDPGRTVRYTYTPAGQLASEIAPTGATLASFSYDWAGRLVTVADGVGTTQVTIWYTGADGGVQRVRNTTGTDTGYTHPLIPLGPYTVGSYPMGTSTMTYVRYDAWGRVAGDDSGTYTYVGEYPDVATVVGTGGDTTVYTYDSRGTQTSVVTTDSTGAVTEQDTRVDTSNDNVLISSVDSVTRYDPANGYAVSETMTTTTFDAGGNPTRREVTDTEGGLTTTQVTTTTYNADGTVASEAQPDGTTTTKTYDAYGNTITAVTAKNGMVTAATSASYNVIGLPITVTDPSGVTTQYQYDLLGDRVSETVTDNGVYQGMGRTVYDGYGRMTFTLPVGQGPCASDTRATNTAGLVTTNLCTGSKGTSAQYDTWGHLALANQYERTTRSVYNAKGQLLQQIGPDQYDSSVDNMAADLYGDASAGDRYVYDSKGNVTTHIDKAGNTTYNTYDTSNRLIQTATGTLVTRYVYDASGNLTQVVYPTQYKSAYDNLSANTYSDTTVGDRYTYDQNGNKLTYLNSQNVETDYTYDDANRLIQSVSLQKVTRWVYDLDGNLTQVVYPNQYNATFDGLTKTPATNTYTDTTVGDRYVYDANGNVTSSTDSNGKVTTSVYTATGTLTSTASSDGSKQSFNKSGKPLTETLPNGVVNTFAYNPDQTLKSVTGSNGITEGYAYDPSGFATGYAFTGAATHQYGYTYDPAGRIASVTLDTTPQAAYQYDVSGELIREDDALLNQTITYAYDTVGNMTGKTVYPYTPGGDTLPAPTTTYTNTFNAANQMTKWQGAPLTYDTQGNLLGLNGATLTWQAGLLSAYTKAGQATTYTYGWDNLRTTKNTGGVVTTYTYDPAGNLIRQVDGSSDLKVYRAADGTPEYLTLNGVTYYYERDLQGDVTGLLDASLNEVVAYTYDAWGKPITTTGSQATGVGALNPVRYRGYAYDTESGLYYLQNRYYSADIDRFISPDPAEFSMLPAASGGVLTANLYSYCLNNPVDLKDPNGHGPVGAIIGAILGFGLGLLLIPRIADSMKLTGWARTAFIWTGVAVFTALGAYAGNYVGEAVFMIYRLGGSLAYKVDEAIARGIAALVRGVMSESKGDGWTIKVGKLTLRVMTSGGGRTNYFRLSGVKGSMTASGAYSSDLAATHIDITLDSIVSVVKTILRLK